MSNLESGMIVYSEEHGGEGKILSMNNEDGYTFYVIDWPSGLKSHPPHEADNFFRDHALRRFPPKEKVPQ